MTDERIAPVQGYSAGIPWSLHLRAWDAYAAKYGKYQSAERIAERAGFSVGELDMFVPGWRDEVSEIAKLEAEVARLTKQRVMPEAFVDDVRKAMAASWHEYVNDSHCYPDEFEILGKALRANFERGGNWSRWVAQRVWLKARAALAGEVEE